MTKTEKRMKGYIEENSSEYIDGIWVTWIAEGTVTVKKEDKFVLDFRETGFKKRGEIFAESDIAPYFDELYLQMLPARFDMILRVCGTVLRNRLNLLNIGLIEKVVMTVRYGVGVQDNQPMSCPHINIQSWGKEGPELVNDELYESIVETMAENLDLLTDSFLNELKHVAETAPEVSDTIPDISNLH